jgi:hypothetical protein
MADPNRYKELASTFWIWQPIKNKFNPKDDECVQILIAIFYRLLQKPTEGHRMLFFFSNDNLVAHLSG